MTTEIRYAPRATVPWARLPDRRTQMYSPVAEWQAVGDEAQAVVSLLQLSQQRFALYTVIHLSALQLRLLFHVLPAGTSRREAATAAMQQLAERSELAGAPVEPIDRTRLNTTVKGSLNDTDCSRTIGSWCKAYALSHPEEVRILTPAALGWTAALNLAHTVLARNTASNGPQSAVHKGLRTMLNDSIPLPADLHWTRRHMLVDLLGLIVESLPEAWADLASRTRAVLSPHNFRSAKQAAQVLNDGVFKGHSLTRLVHELLTALPPEELAARQAVIDHFMHTADTLEQRKALAGTHATYKGVLPMRVPLAELLEKALTIPVLTEVLLWSGYEDR